MTKQVAAIVSLQTVQHTLHIKSNPGFIKLVRILQLDIKHISCWQLKKNKEKHVIFLQIFVSDPREIVSTLVRKDFTV